MKPVLTSEQQMNVFRLRDKMGVLNGDFIKVINGYFSEKAHYDFTGTMQSYIEHVKKLRAMYKMDTDSGSEEPIAIKKADNPPVVIAGGRKIAKALRRNGSSASTAPKAAETPKATPAPSIFAASSPANTAAVPKFGDISMIGKETPAPIIKKPSVVEKAPEAAEPVVQAPAAARKRAIRGGGPLGGSESVIFKGGQGEETKSSTSTTVIPPTTIKFPEPSKDFWTKKSDSQADSSNAGSLFAFLNKDGNTSNSNSSPKKFSGFSFGKKDDDKKEEPADKTDKAPTGSLFGNFGKTSESPVKTLSPESSAPKPAFAFKSSLFGGSSTSSDAKLSFGGSSTSSDAKLSFGGSSDASTAPKLSFGSTLTSSGSTPAPAASLFSGFAGLAQKAMANQNQEEKDGDDGEDAEYVPPKVETVENEEPDAVLSSKVSVFKFTGKEYTKLGVGMLHVKDTSGKHSLLIRAATTTGTVWLNALCNKAMKATKVDEKGERIRLTCPASASEMATMMIRFATADGAKKFTDKIDELTK